LLLHLTVEKLLKIAEDVGEYVTNHWPKQGEDDDNDNSYEHEDECILNQALTFFLWFVNHDDFSL
ncbi:MAG TPA: hypothetical protein PLZ51_05505, partial [Aggregatilineales bacterium]|nr:hypothetical protein [Aggregatilineales bacterium]